MVLVKKKKQTKEASEQLTKMLKKLPAYVLQEHPQDCDLLLFSFDLLIWNSLQNGDKEIAKEYYEHRETYKSYMKDHVEGG